jgi:hypothetical protein
MANKKMAKQEKLEIEKRNLVSTIEGCLKEHQVDLQSSTGISPFYLIEVSAKNKLASDFIDTYKTELDAFKTQLAEKTFSGQSSKQTYGVLIDTDLQFVFAFNRAFADLDREQHKIVFKNPVDLLLGNVYVQQQKPVSSPTIKPISEFPTTMKYSITGKKPSQENKGEYSQEMPSLIDRVRDLYIQNPIFLQETNESLLLAQITYETLTLVDFIRTYPGEVDTFRQKLARKAFGENKSMNDYSLLLTPDLKIKYAFNEAFAKYDTKAKKVVYSSAEEVLLEKTNQNSIDLSSVKPTPEVHVIHIHHREGPMILKYALVGKKE